MGRKKKDWILDTIKWRWWLTCRLTEQGLMSKNKRGRNRTKYIKALDDIIMFLEERGVE